MKPEPTQPESRFTPERKLNLFYILAFIPILPIAFLDPFSAVIPIYGFLLLLMKGASLNRSTNTGVSKLSGLIAMAASLFAHYGLILIYPKAAFYGSANYIVYLFGLLMFFFGFAGVRAAFTSLFLIVAATSSTFISTWLSPFLSPYVDEFASIVIGILRALGIDLSASYSSSVTTISFRSIQGRPIYTVFVYECIGVYSMLVFSIILIVVLLEDRSSRKEQVVWSILGVLGTFAINILRVTLLLLTDYFYGAEAGSNVHLFIGYLLFSIWLIIFLLVYSKRRVLIQRFQKLSQLVKQS